MRGAGSRRTLCRVLAEHSGSLRSRLPRRSRDRARRHSEEGCLSDRKKKERWIGSCSRKWRLEKVQRRMSGDGGRSAWLPPAQNETRTEIRHRGGYQIEGSNCCRPRGKNSREWTGTERRRGLSKADCPTLHRCRTVPVRHRDCPHWPVFANWIHDAPAAVAHLDMLYRERY